MSDDLFPIETTLSPRLRWMQKHNLETEHIPNGGTESAETGDWIPHWICRVKKLHPNYSLYFEREIGSGDTEEESIADFAVNAGIRLWNEEELSTSA